MNKEEAATKPCLGCGKTKEAMMATQPHYLIPDEYHQGEYLGWRCRWCFEDGAVDFGRR